jgi:hypothetical protein
VRSLLANGGGQAGRQVIWLVLYLKLPFDASKPRLNPTLAPPPPPSCEVCQAFSIPVRVLLSTGPSRCLSFSSFDSLGFENRHNGVADRDFSSQATRPILSVHTRRTDPSGPFGRGYDSMLDHTHYHGGRVLPSLVHMGRTRTMPGDPCEQQTLDRPSKPLKFSRNCPPNVHIRNIVPD